MKKHVRTFAEYAYARLRSKCEGLPPRCRRMAVFAALALYMAVSQVIVTGNRRQLPEPEHIRQLDLPGQGAGCINTLKPGSHGDTDRR